MTTLMPKGQDDVDGIRPNAKRFVALEKPRVRKDAREWAEQVWKYTGAAIPDALGLHGAHAQVRGSALLIGWSLATGLFTGMVTAVFVLIWSITLLIGILRWSKFATVVREKTPGVPDRSMTKNRYSRRRGGDR